MIRAGLKYCGEKKSGKVTVSMLLLMACSCIVLAGVFLSVNPSVVPGMDYLENVISPGDLSTSHQNVADLQYCDACHNANSEIPNQKCEKCHELIVEKMQADVGYHGSMQGACVECHTEHLGEAGNISPFVSAEFNHNLADYNLDGKHFEAKCEQCHGTKKNGVEYLQYIGVEHSSCLSCHEDVHEKQLGNDCQKCHSTGGWTGDLLAFNHNYDSTYALHGKHVSTACGKCHNPNKKDSLTKAQFKNVGTACNDCHADPHYYELGDECQKCHNPAGWTGKSVAFNHDRDSKFRLDGDHSKADCWECHKPTKKKSLTGAHFKKLGSECIDCHKDPHFKELGKNCQTCHSPRSWKRKYVTFDHNRDSDFRLKGKHSETQCWKCHNSDVKKSKRKKLKGAHFKKIGKNCVDCHDDPHQKTLGNQCQTCHTSNAWKGSALAFDHNVNSKFKIDALHSNVSCQDCHTNKQYKMQDTSCSSCHADYEQMLEGKYLPDEEVNADPHFKLTKCTDCHDTNLTKSTQQSYMERCAKCHHEEYQKLFVDRRGLLNFRLIALQQTWQSLPATVSIEQMELYKSELTKLQKIGSHNFKMAYNGIKKIENKLVDISKKED